MLLTSYGNYCVCLHSCLILFIFASNTNKMQLQLTGVSADRPDKRAISRTLSDIADDVDQNLATELTGYLLEGSPVDITVSFNESSAFRALRKLDVEYEIMEE